MNLKQILTTAVLAACVSTASMAQSYEKGDNLLNVGVGLGGSLGMPIGLSYEHGFSDKISGGAYVGYASKSENFGAWSWKWTYMLAAARASYHFDFNVDKLDPYLGVILGYNYAKGEWEGGGAGAWTGADAGGVVYGGHAGARYFLSPKFGLFAEVGYGLGNLNVGLTFKL
ncbi:MAG TPA: hypothetical protein PKA53_00045 [Sphingobacterium sp.]|nr:hypothetical protein [Sphingobacterium sp.]